MAYKFQLGAATLSGSLTQEGDIVAKSGGDASKGVISASLGLRMPAAGTITARGGDLALSVADLLQIDGITAGTAAASKAVVLDSNKDITGLRNVTATGYFEIGSAQLTQADLLKLDGITAGAAAANKAMVLDASLDISGARHITISGELDAASGDFSGDIDVAGTANLDAVDIDGAVQADGTITVGVDDTGYDVKFFGDTASAYMLWDASADDLILAGAAGLVVPDGKLTLNATAVSSTATELNLLDGSQAGAIVNSKAVIYSGAGAVAGASMIVNDDSYIGAVGDTDMLQFDATNEISVANDLDFMILKAGGLTLADGAVSSTAAELNLLDGSQAGAVVNSKGVIYSNAGAVAGTSFIVNDDSYIGAVGDTDMMQFDAGTDITLANDLDFKVMKVGGLQLADGAVSSTAAELNLLDGSSAGGVVANKGVIYDGSGNVLCASVGVADNGYVGAAGDTDMMQFEAGSDINIANNLDFNILKAGGLNLADGAVTSTAAELNFLDGFAAATYAPAADGIAWFDATDSKIKYQQNDAFLTLIAGAGLSVSGNKLVADGAGTPSALPTHGGGTLAEGYNFFDAAVTGSVILSMPTGSTRTPGDVLSFKAKDGVTVARYIEIRRAGTDTIDGETSIRVESPYGAVSMVYVAAGDYRIV